MRKIISVILTLALVLALAAPAFAVQVAWPDGRMISGSLRAMQVENQIYVYLDDFNSVPGVRALNDFGSRSGRTDIGVVMGSGVAVVVDKRAATAAALELRKDKMEIIPIPCRVTDDGLAYLPLRLVAGLLGATVDYDPATGAVKVTKCCL
ncbi:MAG: hypothetical protein ACOYU7_05080 [Bacillota bacterium]